MPETHAACSVCEGERTDLKLLRGGFARPERAQNGSCWEKERKREKFALGNLF